MILFADITGEHCLILGGGGGGGADSLFLTDLLEFIIKEVSDVLRPGHFYFSLLNL